MAEWPYNTARWQRLRKMHLAIEPLCRGCMAMGGKRTQPNHVDHIKPMSEGGDAFPGHDGLASYCHACHSAKTARGSEAGAIKTTKPRKGCDANGNPLDPAHPWNGKSLTAGRTRATWDCKKKLVSDCNLSDPDRG